MTDSTTSIQAWETIETTDALTAEKHSSVVESFSSHYHKFLGYQPGEEELWWAGAAGEQVSEDARQPFWSHPLAKTGILGASGLAATLLVGVALSETANDKPPRFTFRDPTLSSQLDLSKEQPETSAIPQISVSPAAPSVEFSDSQPASSASSDLSKAETLPEVEIPQFTQSPGPWNLPSRPMLSEDGGGTSRISRPTVGDRSSVATPALPQPQPQSVRPSPDLSQSSADRTRLAPASLANGTQSPMLSVLDRLPMLEEADPQEMEATGAVGSTPLAANPAGEVPVAPTADTPSTSNNAAIYPGSEALPLPAQPPLPSTPVDGSQVNDPQAKLSFESLPMLPIAESTPNAANATAPEPVPFPTQPGVEFEQPNGTERFLSDRSLSFSQQATATQNVMTYYPVFGATVQSAVQLVANAAAQPDGAAQPSVMPIAAATPHSGATANVAKASPALNSLRDFLNYKRLSSGSTARVMPLTRQAATEVQHNTAVEQFRIFQLAPREYQTAWVIRKGAVGQQTPTPTYGFIDYQRQMIVLPNVS